ncbi:MAG: phosphatase PAP2 family protein [Simkania sp.]|nr:phosphatase PAP2 family protein [Simkania sp.]
MNLKSKAFLILLLIVFSMTILLVILSYFFVDREVSTWVYEKQLRRFAFLNWFSEIAKYLNALSAFSLIYFGIKRPWKNGKIPEQGLLAIALSSIFASVITDSSKAFFGRYWPETWIQNNPSWIQNKAYGFHFFHVGWSYFSFPSGHTAIIVAVGTMIWLVFPKWRLLSLLLITLEVMGLVGMNFHFVGDVIGGAFIGWLVALFAYHYLIPNRAT